jgi:hypothetical protein
MVSFAAPAARPLAAHFPRLAPWAAIFRRFAAGSEVRMICAETAKHVHSLCFTISTSLSQIPHPVA